MRNGPSLAALVLLAIPALSACTSDSRSANLAAAGAASQTPGDRLTTTALLRLGDEVYARGDVVTATAFYRQAVARGDGGSLALGKLGAALAASGAIEQAAGAYRAALSKDPTDPDALRGLGAADLALGQPREGAELLAKAVAAHPSDLKAMRNLGVAHDMLGEHAQARATYEKALKLAPDDVDVKSDLALSRALSGDFETAVQLMREAAASPYARPQHAANLALILVLADREGEAATVAGEAMSAADAQAFLTWAKRLRGITDSALRAAAIGATAAR